MAENSSITEIILDDSVLALKPESKHERDVAIADFIAANHFTVEGGGASPYRLTVSLVENRLILEVMALSGGELTRLMLPLKALRGIIRDYFLICESYSQAVETADPRKIEAVDMGRRGMHNEGSEMLQELLSPKAAMDLDTARRLFTLICALHSV